MNDFIRRLASNVRVSNVKQHVTMYLCCDQMEIHGDKIFGEILKIHVEEKTLKISERKVLFRSDLNGGKFLQPFTFVF